MALTVQGSKHVLFGEKDLSYGPGQSLLTTIDLPVSYHITRATATDPYLGNHAQVRRDPHRSGCVQNRGGTAGYSRTDASLLASCSFLLKGWLFDETTVKPGTERHKSMSRCCRYSRFLALHRVVND
jgi:hypothetical protein